MIIYNVTVKIDNDILEDWLDWMKNVHIPEVMKTGCFEKNWIYRILVDEDDGHSFSIQYSCLSMEKLEHYQNKYAPALQQEHSSRYQNKFVAFRTLLESVK